jgi:hypothetical protein
LIPIQFGFFKTSGPLSIEGYLRYVINIQGAWTATGTDLGTGSTKYASTGLGLQSGFAFHTSPRFKAEIVGLLEYISQKVHLSFSDSTAIDLRSTSYLMGAGLRGQVWLGDLWVLSLLAAYQYSPQSTWNVYENALFMRRNHSAGALKDPNGNGVASKFGGVALEATLKLNFY